MNTAPKTLAFTALELNGLERMRVLNEGTFKYLMHKNRIKLVYKFSLWLKWKIISTFLKLNCIHRI